MDFLNQAFGQIRDLFLSMTPAARVTAALLTGVIAVSLVYLIQQHSASPDDYLFNGEILPPRDADRVEAAIAQAGLEGFERVGNRIKVPRGKKAKYLAAVVDGGALPPDFHKLLEKSLDLSPFTDRETRRQRHKAAREQQLSMIIRAMDGVEDAQVIYDIREPRGLSNSSHATASVSVQMAPSEALNPRRAKRIKQAVAAAIAELSPENVTVTNLGDGSMYGGSGEISAESFENPYFQQRITYERWMKSNIENLLQYVPGLLVQVSAELDVVVERTTKLTEPNGEGIARRAITEEEDSETSEVDNGARPGTYAQGPTRNDDQVAEVTIKKKASTRNSDEDNFIPIKEEFFRETGMTPEHVRVAIAIPSDYLLSVWREQERLKGNDPSQPVPATIQSDLERLKISVAENIKEAVVVLLPKELAENSFSDITVSFFDSLTPDPIEPPSKANQMLSWAGQNFSTMTMAVIAMASLVMLRSMVKSIPPSEPVTAISTATLALNPGEKEASADESQDSEPQEGSRLKLRLNKGPTLKDDLTEIVREDPDAAAAILRSWIGNAG